MNGSITPHLAVGGRAGCFSAARAAAGVRASGRRRLGGGQLHGDPGIRQRAGARSRGYEAKESDTVMRVLEAAASTSSTRSAGGFVHSIDGVAEGERGGDPYDWFFYVDGVESPVGAAGSPLHGGEAIWWDYATGRRRTTSRPWSAPGRRRSERLGGARLPGGVECEGGGEACEAVRERGALEAKA